MPKFVNKFGKVPLILEEAIFKELNSIEEKYKHLPNMAIARFLKDAIIAQFYVQLRVPKMGEDEIPMQEPGEEGVKKK